GARPVLDDERAAGHLGEPLSNDACDDVVGAACRVRRDDPHGLRSERLCVALRGGECERARDENTHEPQAMHQGIDQTIAAASRTLLSSEVRMRYARASSGSPAVRLRLSWFALRTAGSFSASTRRLRSVCVFV